MADAGSAFQYPFLPFTQQNSSFVCGDTAPGRTLTLSVLPGFIARVGRITQFQPARCRQNFLGKVSLVRKHEPLGAGDWGALGFLPFSFLDFNLMPGGIGAIL